MVKDLRMVNAIDRINEIIPKCKSFKIGKSGEKLLDRLNQPDYNGYYTHIEKVFVGTKEEVDEAEAFLIDRYIGHPKCDNKKDGDASIYDTMADDADEYYVYVVWR